MKIDSIEIIGLIAAFLTTSAFIPQVIKIIRTQSTKSISLTMYITLVTGVFLWFLYGIFKESLAIILANGLTFILQMIILFLKIKNRKVDYKNKKQKTKNKKQKK